MLLSISTFTNGDFSQQLLLVVMLLLMQMFFLRGVLNVKKLGSPIYVMSLIYLVIGIVGYIVYVFFPEFAYEKPTKDAFIITITNEQATSTLLYFFHVVNIIIFGSIIFLLLEIAFAWSSQQHKKLPLNSKISLELTQKKLDFARDTISSYKFRTVKLEGTKAIDNKKKFKGVGINTNWVVLICLFFDVIFIIGCGIDTILISPVYISIKVKVLVTIGSLGIYGTTGLLGYASAEAKRSSKILLYSLLGFINFLLILALASRRLGFIPILFAIGYNFNPNKNKKAGRILTIVSSALFLPLFGLPLYLRGGDGHGLIPYFYKISQMDLGELLGVSTVFKNIIFSFPLTSKVMEFRNNFDVSFFWTSINPLPGNATNWYEIGDDLRLNYFVPFNTVGEAYLYGDWIFFFFFFAVGFTVMYISRVVEKRASTKSGRVFGLLLTSMIAIFSLFSLQYNMRAALRYLYYALVGALIIERQKSKDAER